MKKPLRARSRLQASHHDRSEQRRELYFFALFRSLQAAIIAFFVFSPTGLALASLVAPKTAIVNSLAYLCVSALLLFARKSPNLARQALIGAIVDIFCTSTALFALEGPDTGLALLLIVNIGAAALLLPLRTGLSLAGIAGCGNLLVFVLGDATGALVIRAAVEPVMFSVTYLSTAVLCHMLGKQLRESIDLAERRGEQAANLVQINDLIIRRLRSGVLVVTPERQIVMMNEAAWALLGEPSAEQRDLSSLSPALTERLSQWIQDTATEPSPLILQPETPEVLPRFTQLSLNDPLYLVFLDDGTLVSRRAEQLTLATLGRLSASIAHEIRNPLSAISHAAQLLEESPDLPAGDRRLIEIVLSHCQRVNGIVNNVLALSRRERSRPETIELTAWAREFVRSYRAEHFIDEHTLTFSNASLPAYGVFDPAHLHQIVSSLVSNALEHGKRPDAALKVVLRSGPADDSGFPTIEVEDGGSGIRAHLIDRIFDPFFTTSDLGSGLGLYIARQLSEANQASLEYHQGKLGGACFRLTLSRPLIGLSGSTPR